MSAQHLTKDICPTRDIPREMLCGHIAPGIYVRTISFFGFQLSARLILRGGLEEENINQNLFTVSIWFPFKSKKIYFRSKSYFKGRYGIFRDEEKGTVRPSQEE